MTWSISLPLRVFYLEGPQVLAVTSVFFYFYSGKITGLYSIQKQGLTRSLGVVQNVPLEAVQRGLIITAPTDQSLARPPFLNI